MKEKKKIALICGVTGQDGSYLAASLGEKGYDVWGTTRDIKKIESANHDKLGISGSVRLLSMQPENFTSVSDAINQSKADEVFYLSGQSSVALSFELPYETIQSITVGVLNVLEACRLNGRSTRIYFAGSAECFGDTGEQAADEKTRFSPVSPYGVAKSAAYWLVRNYREAFNLWTCTGILFNHESPLRPSRFVTQRIIGAAKRIAAGSKERLEVGNIDIYRDWGWAPEYVETMWQMLQRESPTDYVIATGETRSLREFIEESFLYFGLDWREHTRIREELMRPIEIVTSRADPTLAEKDLEWKAENRMEDVIKRMIEYDLP